VLELDGGNAARRLLDEMARTGRPTAWAGTPVYLGLCSANGSTVSVRRNVGRRWRSPAHSLRQAAPARARSIALQYDAVWRISSGDPQRASVAIDTTRDIASGTAVQVRAQERDCHAPHASTHRGCLARHRAVATQFLVAAAPTDTSPAAAGGLRFVAMAEDARALPAAAGLAVGSDLGVIGGAAQRPSTVHTLPGSVAELVVADAM